MAYGRPDQSLRRRRGSNAESARRLPEFLEEGCRVIMLRLTPPESRQTRDLSHGSVEC